MNKHIQKQLINYIKSFPPEDIYNKPLVYRYLCTLYQKHSGDTESHPREYDYSLKVYKWCGSSLQFDYPIYTSKKVTCLRDLQGIKMKEVAEVLEKAY